MSGIWWVLNQSFLSGQVNDHPLTQGWWVRYGRQTLEITLVAVDETAGAQRSSRTCLMPHS